MIDRFKDILIKLSSKISNLSNEATFKMRWKKDGAIYVKYYSKKRGSEEEKKADAFAKMVVTLVKILKEDGDYTQKEILEPFKIAVAQEFGMTKKEYYQREFNKKANIERTNKNVR